MAEQQRLANVHHRQQAGLRAEVLRDAVSVWTATFDPDDTDATSAEARRLLIALVRDRHSVSRRLAEAYYLRARQLAGFPEQFRPVQAPPPSASLLGATIGATGIAAYFVALRGGQSRQQAKQTSAVTVSGSVARLVAAGGRETVHRSVDNDGRAVGWVRVTDADPCHFCAMLASRGPVYKTRESAGDPRGDGRRYHDHDACVAAPVFVGTDQPWVEQAAGLSDTWARVTDGKSGTQARQTWRQFWENREA